MFLKQVSKIPKLVTHKSSLPSRIPPCIMCSISWYWLIMYQLFLSLHVFSDGRCESHVNSKTFIVDWVSADSEDNHEDDDQSFIMDSRRTQRSLHVSWFTSDVRISFNSVCHITEKYNRLYMHMTSSVGPAHLRWNNHNDSNWFLRSAFLVCHSYSKQLYRGALPLSLDSISILHGHSAPPQLPGDAFWLEATSGVHTCAHAMQQMTCTSCRVHI